MQPLIETEGAGHIMADRDAPSNAMVVARLVGEFLREAAVLVAVFVPLDWVLQRKPLTLAGVVAILLGVGTLLAAGVLLEVKAR